jgi:CubicO group peptidase (beta-lactamase class C family)
MLASSTLAQSLPRVHPEDVGLSTERLERLNSVMEGFVDRGQVAGIVTLIVRKGHVVHFESIGHADQNVAMSDDAIFRIASQSYGWGGAYHTTYWVDPAEELVAVMMTQLLPAPSGVSVTAMFRTMVYQAIVESDVSRH